MVSKLLCSTNVSHCIDRYFTHFSSTWPGKFWEIVRDPLILLPSREYLLEQILKQEYILAHFGILWSTECDRSRVICIVFWALHRITRRRFSVVVNSSLSLVLEDYLNSSWCLFMFQLAVVIVAAHVIVLLYVSVSLVVDILQSFWWRRRSPDNIPFSLPYLLSLCNTRTKYIIWRM